MWLFTELKRRNVFRVGAAYAVASWLLIQIAETILPLFGFNDGPARIVVIVLAIGFPLVLVFSWLYELTPEGLQLERDVDRSRSVVHHTGKKLDRAIIVVLVLALGYFAFDKFVLDPQRDIDITESARQEGRTEALVESYGDHSIAVFPFVNMSSDPEQTFFSDGIAEELLNLLAKIPQLRVTSRSSAFAFRGDNINIPEVAEKLNVAHILEGSVRKAGNQIRITVQLIEARSDTHLWSETYDRPLDDIFAIQDEIAAAVVAHLKIAIMGEVPTAQRADPEAFRLYMLANHFAAPGYDAEGLRKAEALYKQALAIDPDYERPWRKLSVVYGSLGSLGRITPDEVYALQAEVLQKAIEINPASARIYTSLGALEIRSQYNFQKAAQYFRTAVGIDPYDFTVLNNSALFLARIGRMDEAITIFEYLLTQNPLNPFALVNLAAMNMLGGYPDQAIAAGETALLVKPETQTIRYLMGRAYLLKGQPEKALELFEQEPREQDRLLGEFMAHHKLGHTEASETALESLIQKYGPKEAVYIACAQAYRNKADLAFEWLETAAKYRDDVLIDIATETMLTNLVEDPRWLPFAERINMSPSELEAIEFEVILPE